MAHTLTRRSRLTLRLAPVAILGSAALITTLGAGAAHATAPPSPVPVPLADQLLGSLPPLPLIHPASAYAWYTPPNPLPAGQPGDIIKSRVIPINPTVPDAKTIQFMYLSTNQTGHLVPVTGTLLTPALVPANGDLIDLSHGTMGLGKNCAPSQGFNPDTIDPRNPDYEALTYQQYLAHGDSIVLTDYLGGGVPVGQEYLVGRSEAYDDLDAAKAAEKLPGTGLSASSPVGLSGYSQGGQTAAWADQIAPTYAPSLQIKGAIIDAPPVDMQAQYNQLNGNPTAGAGLGLAAIEGAANAFHNTGLNQDLTAFGQKVFARDNTACVAEALGTFGTITAGMVTNPDVSTTPAFVADLHQSLLGTMRPTTPAYIYQGSADTVVPPSFGPQLYQDWCQNSGVSVEFTQLPAQEHLSGNVTGTPAAINWLSNRLAGQPLPTGCTIGQEIPGL